MSKPKLLPCPFCGGEGMLKENSKVFSRDSGKAFKVECRNRYSTCQVNMQTHYKLSVPEAVNAWNRRTN